MELDLRWYNINAAVLLGALTYILVFTGFIGRVVEWYYVKKLGKKQSSLPPGDMGLPLIGNTLSFIRAYKSQFPESFLNNLKKRYGKTCIYKTNLFWKPSIIVCGPELCRKVLTDDEQFTTGYEVSSLISGGKPFDIFSGPGHKRFRRLITSPINGQDSLSLLIGSIEEIVINTLKEWTRMNQPIDFLSEVHKIAFKVITTIFLGPATDDSSIALMEKNYTYLFQGLFSTPINIPGFTYHRALKARKMLVTIIQAILAERREKESNVPNIRKGLIDLIKEAENDQGEKIMDEEHIIVVLIIFLVAGRETSGRTAAWATIYLHQHPQFLQKAKEEQEEIIRRRPSSQKGLTLDEIKQMKYLSKVIDETLRIRTNTFALFREAKQDTELNGFLVPKGWKVLVWTSDVHMDPEIYSNPKEFNPSRWDDLRPKAGIFQPFGAGSSSCPGADLAKLEISIFLHYFLLNYKLEQVNPGGPINYLPSPEPVDKFRAKIIKLD